MGCNGSRLLFFLSYMFTFRYIGVIKSMPNYLSSTPVCSDVTNVKAAVNELRWHSRKRSKCYYSKAGSEAAAFPIRFNDVYSRWTGETKASRCFAAVCPNYDRATSHGDFDVEKREDTAARRGRPTQTNQSDVSAIKKQIFCYSFYNFGWIKINWFKRI